MEHTNNWSNEIAKRVKVFNECYSDEWMTREVYEWNKAFVERYKALTNWTSEDGSMRFTRSHIFKELGIPEGVDSYSFINRVRDQLHFYVRKTFRTMYEAGKTNAEIAAELSKSEEWVKWAIQNWID